MRKETFFIALFCAIFCLSFLPANTVLDAEVACTKDADCANESLCYSQNGLRYGYYCCLEQAGCAIDWLYGKCVLDGVEIKINAW